MIESENRKDNLFVLAILWMALVFVLLPLNSVYADKTKLKITGEGSLLEQFWIQDPAVFDRIEMWAEIDVRWKITTLLGEPIVFCDAKWKPTSINVYGRSVDGKSENVLLFSKFAFSDEDYRRKNDRIDVAFSKVDMIDLEVEILSDHKSSFNDGVAFNCNVGVLAPAGDKYSWNIPVSPDWDEFLYRGGLDGPHFKFLSPDRAKAHIKKANGNHFKRTYTGWQSVALAPSKYKNVYVDSWNYVKVDFDFSSLRELYYEEKAAYRVKQEKMEAQERLKRAAEVRQGNKQDNEKEKRTTQVQEEKRYLASSEERMNQLLEDRRIKKENAEEEKRIAKVQKEKRQKLEKLQKEQLDKVCGKVSAEMSQCQRKECGWRPTEPLRLLSYSSWDDDCDAACKRRRERNKREQKERDKRDLARRTDRWRSCMDRAEETCSGQGIESEDMCRAEAKTVPDFVVETTEGKDSRDLLKSFGIKGGANSGHLQQKNNGKAGLKDLNGLLGSFGNNDRGKTGNKQLTQPKVEPSSMQSILDNSGDGKSGNRQSTQPKVEPSSMQGILNKYNK